MPKLHIGCGAQILSNYVNIDIRRVPGVDVVAKAWELGMYANGSIDEIFSRHMIEHLTLIQARLAFEEWHRVLRPEGHIELICPDRDYHIWQLLHPNDKSQFNPAWTNRQHGLAGLHGWQSYPGDVHQWSWTKEEIRPELDNLGFKVRFKPGRVCDIHLIATKA